MKDSIPTYRHLACALLLALCCVPAALLHAQAASEPAPPDQLRTLSRDELDVVKVLTRQEDAWNKGDLDAFVSGYKNSPDILFVGSHISRGFTDMVAEYKHDYPTKEAMGSLSFSDLEPRILDEHFAILVGRYKLERSKKAGGNAEGAFSMVLEKTKEGWKIIVDHTT
jgi:ketosteroid isomerase-like protein